MRTSCLLNPADLMGYKHQNTVLVSENCWPTLCNNAVFGLHQWNCQATCRHEKHQAGGPTSVRFMYICLSWQKIWEQLDTPAYKSLDETVFLLVLTSQNVFLKMRVSHDWRCSVSCWTVCLWLSERITNEGLRNRHRATLHSPVSKCCSQSILTVNTHIGFSLTIQMA